VKKRQGKDADHTSYNVTRKLRERTDILLSREKGTVYKDPGGRISVALVYPNTYHVGMSNLGFQGIYGLLNSMHDVVCERAFLPDEKDLPEYLRTGTELFTMETKRPLNRFDIVAFSVSFENDYPNIVTILDLSHIPRNHSERSSHHPLIILGGASAFFNPEPVADFFDLCFIGEADEMLPEFMDICRTAGNRSALLRTCLKLDGLYVPAFYRIAYDADGKIADRQSEEKAPEFIRKRYLRDISRSTIQTSIITPDTEFSEMHLIEAMRGCPWSCRFCVTGKIYSPPRAKSFPALKNEIRKALTRTRRIGLVGPSLSDYPDITTVLKIPEVDFSITSLRANAKLRAFSGLLKGHRSVSIAPEAGTERLRNVIRKRVTEQDILDAAEFLSREGIDTLRLYFMVGLPTETREDTEGIVSLAKKIRAVSAKGSLTLSIGTFVPKPFTPFQWHCMEGPAEIKERLKIIKKALLPIKGIKVFHDMPKYAYMQGLFAAGDRRVAKVVEEMSTTEDWTKAAEIAGIRKDFYIFRKKEFTETMPWDFIDAGIEKEKLWDEYQEALSLG
jgi:radical SAM superfamily enzyme YgiQ (UPF0313 family)